MKRLVQYGLLAALLLPLSVFAAADKAKETFKAGKDYVILTTAAKPKQDSIQVVEFFSYGCSWCYRFESSIKPWLSQQPKNIAFKRIPVVFRPSWQVYARAFYIAEDLGVSKKISAALFKAIHDKNLDLANETKMADFFNKYGVNKKVFDNAYNYSPTIDAYMKRDYNLAQSYRINETPSIVIGGKYKTTSGLAKGDFKRMIRIMEFLIKKQQAEQKSA